MCYRNCFVPKQRTKGVMAGMGQKIYMSGRVHPHSQGEMGWLKVDSCISGETTDENANKTEIK